MTKYYCIKPSEFVAAMKKHNLSFRKMEALTQIPKSRLCRLSSGKTVSCDLSTIAIISSVLSVPMDDIADLGQEYNRPFEGRK